MDDKTKVCVECRHFETDGYARRCNVYRRSVEEFDPITGKVDVTYSGTVPAAWMRGHNGRMGEYDVPKGKPKCGPDGTLWEERDVSFYVGRLVDNWRLYVNLFKDPEDRGFGIAITLSMLGLVLSVLALVLKFL